MILFLVSWRASKLRATLSTSSTWFYIEEFIMKTTRICISNGGLEYTKNHFHVLVVITHLVN